MLNWILDHLLCLVMEAFLTLLLVVISTGYLGLIIYQKVSGTA